MMIREDWAKDFCFTLKYTMRSPKSEYLILYNNGLNCYDEFVTLEDANASIQSAKKKLAAKGVTHIGIGKVTSVSPVLVYRWVMHLRDLTFDTPTNEARLTPEALGQEGERWRAVVEEKLDRLDAVTTSDLSHRVR